MVRCRFGLIRDIGEMRVSNNLFLLILLFLIVLCFCSMSVSRNLAFIVPMRLHSRIFEQGVMHNHSCLERTGYSLRCGYIHHAFTAVLSRGKT